ncbi:MULTISPECIES: hypothetical protein [unclassified Rhizobium]|uniref:hypothetical protein n=1 Tax=unclassified Rhizobium TaxID=2613769 RepID=UPI001C83C4E8|nr:MULTISPECIES: hypothetical protein [unclassified Rhizobium]MBX5222544.1 hypothetical protein [Rhizobium sp. NLR8a]MBX5230171.1 hypothetical protein [Rhizobium sp. NLR9b]MBX5242148.1 hypothetical protein [Rhizobium sp. NLR22b]MBX5290838.1 hypothetical protein [Rhizobium sp. NLR10b]
MDRRVDRLEPGETKARRSENGDFDMQKTLAAIALTLSIAAGAGPAFAIGPASLARDLIYTSAIGRSPEIPLTTRAGFVRPSAPLVLRGPAVVEARGYQFKAYSRSLSVAIEYVFSTAVGAVEAVTFLR